MKINNLFLLITILGMSQLSKAQENSINFVPKPDKVQEIVNPIINLSGTWDFNASPAESFWKSVKYNRLKWNKIEVPGEWLMQGYQVEPGKRSAYGKKLIIPKEWKGSTIYMKCDGVYSLTSVYLNGKVVGSHEGGFTPFQIDLSSNLKFGKENELIFSVQNESLADTLASATQYAAHQLGGITRKIEVFAVPQTHLVKFNLTTELDENYTNASLKIDLALFNTGRRLSSKQKIQITLIEQNRPSAQHSKEYTFERLTGQTKIEKVIYFPVDHPKLWDPEHPNLYEVLATLIVEGKETERISQKIGFREIEVVGNQVFVNGTPIKLRGINRHEVHPLRGRSLTMKEWSADAQLFKEANLNYIRTSHYPPAEEFIALCDSIGLFVECESPMCWVGHNANANWIKENPRDLKFKSLIRQQVLETVAQYRNHPSVLIWSMANESTWSSIWEEVLVELNHTDPSRPVSFHDQAYGGYNNYGNVFTQIANIHYPGPGGPAVAKKFERPLLFGEYAHLNTYNRQEIVTDPGVRDAWGRGLESMWDNMYYSTGCLGGAIWSGVDDVFYLPEGKAVGYGEWGPIDGWRRKKPEYFHLKKIYSPVKIITRKLELPGPGKPFLIPIENRYSFTDLSEVQINWTVGDNHGTSSMNLGPGDSGLLQVWTNKSLNPDEQLKLEFVSPQGFIIDSYQFEFKHTKEKQESAATYEPELSILEIRATVRVDDVEWEFDARSGKLNGVRKDNQDIILSGPELMLLPLSTGPCDTEHSLLIEPLNNTCRNWKGKITGAGKDDGVYIEVKGTYDEADLELIYHFNHQGEVIIDYTVTCKEDINPRQIGLVFDLPAIFDRLEWERNGQWTSYPDLHPGRSHGETSAFPNGTRTQSEFGVEPKWDWSLDYHPMGINDFRATRDKLIWATITNKKGSGIKFISNGSGAVRAFVDQQKVHVLTAGFSTAGGDLFFSTHLKDERNPLKAGDKFKGQAVLRIQ